MMISRRDLFKLAGISALPFVVPAALLPETCITFVDIVFDDEQFKRAMHIDNLASAPGGKASVTVSLDMDAAWKAVRLVDDQGRHWTTDGKSLRYGDIVIPIPGVDE